MTFAGPLLGLVFALGGLLQPAGARTLPRVALPEEEEFVDAVLASVDLEDDLDPIFAMHSDLRLLRETERCVALTRDEASRAAAANAATTTPPATTPPATTTPATITTTSPATTATPTSATTPATTERPAEPALQTERSREEDAERRRVFSRLIAELVVARAAGRASEDDVGAQLDIERQSVLTEVSACGGLANILAAASVGSTEFDGLVLRRLVARRYLLAHAPRLIEPAERDLRAAYDHLRAEAPGRPAPDFASSRRALRDDLLRRNFTSAVLQFLRSLGSRARVIVYEDHPR